MTLESLYYISQTVAVIAILGTLVILIAQNRQERQLAVQEAQRELTEMILGLTRDAYNSPGLADIYVRGGRDLASLTDEEQVRFITFATYIARSYEHLHLSHLRSPFPEAQYKAHMQGLADGLARPGIWAVFTLRRAWFTPEFAALMDRLHADTTSDPSRAAPLETTDVEREAQ